MSSLHELIGLLPERMSLQWAVRGVYTVDGKLMRDGMPIKHGMELVVTTGESFIPRRDNVTDVFRESKRSQQHVGMRASNAGSQRLVWSGRSLQEVPQPIRHVAKRVSSGVSRKY